MFRLTRWVFCRPHRTRSMHHVFSFTPTVLKRFCHVQPPKRGTDLPKRKVKRLAPSALDVEEGRGVCSAYCVRNSIFLSKVAESLRSSSFEIKRDEAHTTFTSNHVRVFVEDVVHAHFQSPDASDISGHAFIFQSGAVVFWGLPLSLTRKLVGQVLVHEEDSPRFKSRSYLHIDKALPFPMQDFDHEFKYTVDKKLNEATFRNDEIQLSDFTDVEQLLAISYGLAQSVKLQVFEEEIDSLVHRTRSLPDELARNGNIKLSHKQLKILIGELLAARYSVNLVSDILDTPEYFWQHAELERLYNQCASEVELRQRARILDTRTRVIKDSLSLLNNELSSSSSDRVERAILFLIAVEVSLEIGRLLPALLQG